MNNTIGELRKALEGHPDDTPVVVNNCQGILDEASFYKGDLHEFSLEDCEGGSFCDAEDGKKFFAIYSD